MKYRSNFYNNDYVQHFQAQYYVALLNNIALLPTKDEMFSDAKLKSRKKKHGHFLADVQWAYHADLARMGHFAPLPPRYEEGYERWFKQQRQQPWTFKNSKFWLSEDGKNVTIKS